MYATTISQYLSLIRKRGLAVNNLYMIQIGVPNALYTNWNISLGGEYNIQSDANKNDNTQKGLLEGLINTKKYTTGFNKIKSSLGLGGNPTGGSSNSSVLSYDNTEKVCMLCTSAELPFYKQKINNTFYNHMTRKMVTGVDTDAINLSFYVDKDNSVLSLFQKWQELINNTSSDVDEGMISYKADYAAKEIVISLINKNVNGDLLPYHSAVLNGAFPSYIRPLRINNGSSELLQLEVTIEYDKIKHYNNDLTDIDSPFNTPIMTGLNLLDMKNKVSDAISEGRNMINNVRNDVKNVSSNINNASKTIKNLFR